MSPRSLALAVVSLAATRLLVHRGASGADLGGSVRGLGLAVAAFAAATLMMTVLGRWWHEWQSRAAVAIPPPLVAWRPRTAPDLLAFSVLVSAPAQELFYRGLLCMGLTQLGVGPRWVVSCSAPSYAGLHLLFPGIQSVRP